VNEVQQIAPEEYEVTVVISNDLGLHARPAAMVAQAAQKYASEVQFILSDQKANAKSILDILSLAAGKGTALKIRGKGTDAKNCIEEIANLVRLHFMEESA
jgi:phosphocarrier protein